MGGSPGLVRLALSVALLPTAVVAMSARPAAANIDADTSVCFVAVPDYYYPPREGFLAVVNLTPVNASTPGFGLLMSSAAGEVPPVASNVNFGPGSVDPNLGVAVTGASGEVCFANSDHGDVDLVADGRATG